MLPRLDTVDWRAERLIIINKRPGLMILLQTQRSLFLDNWHHHLPRTLVSPYTIHHTACSNKSDWCQSVISALIILLTPVSSCSVSVCLSPQLKLHFSSSHSSIPLVSSFLFSQCSPLCGVNQPGGLRYPEPGKILSIIIKEKLNN